MRWRLSKEWRNASYLAAARRVRWRHTSGFSFSFCSRFSSVVHLSTYIHSSKGLAGVCCTMSRDMRLGARTRRRSFCNKKVLGAPLAHGAATAADSCGIVRKGGRFGLIFLAMRPRRSTMVTAPTTSVLIHNTCVYGRGRAREQGAQPRGRGGDHHLRRRATTSTATH